MHIFYTEYAELFSDYLTEIGELMKESKWIKQFNHNIKDLFFFTYSISICISIFFYPLIFRSLESIGI